MAAFKGTRPASAARARRPGARARPRSGCGLAVVSATGLLALAGCTPPDEPEGMHVVAGFSPLEFLGTEIGGPEVTVTSLTADGADPHSLELSPVQVGEMESADLVIYLSGLQPATDEAVDMVDPAHVVDVEAVARAQLPADAGPPDVDPDDPHFWLDPLRFAAAGHEVATELAALDPKGAAGYRARAQALEADLMDLDGEFGAVLAGCTGATLVTSHEAFGYLADRYGLEQVGIAGVDPEVEPSPARMREVAGVIADTDVLTIFFEARASPRVVEVLAEEMGVQVDVLDPMERGTGADYVEVMRANLEALGRGLNCPG
ncbi:metal ABC transporter substrate-binding protein [Pseudactinotalea sp. Z1739]|uniref:metal ABC transporter substrate-binding protein n=1 Tax=Pseudactinotalea sp. Z1739 TaxID=3413028 RepID=UPI003C7D9994